VCDKLLLGNTLSCTVVDIAIVIDIGRLLACDHDVMIIIIFLRNITSMMIIIFFPCHFLRYIDLNKY